MELLITNDDGIDAPGLAALRVAAAGLGRARVVAPKQAVSGCGHSATTDRALRVERRSHHTYAVDGTPADCVRIAFHDFETPLDWVLAGINRGGNLGVDVYYSGTVAAVREAALRGVPGIAVSHYHNRPLSEQDWERAVEWTTPILERLMAKRPRPGAFWNVNLPSDPAGSAGSTGSTENARPEVIFCPLDPSPLPLSFESGENGDRRYNGKYIHRERQSGADVDVCFRGAISVTEISVMEPSR